MTQSYNFSPQAIQQQQMYQGSYMRPPVLSGLRGRPVTSLEEARAQSIDFDGSIFFFPDLVNKRIFTKQINMDGTASLNVYYLGELPVNENAQPAVSMDNFVTREEFESVLAQLKASFQPPQGQVSAQKPEVLNF